MYALHQLRRRNLVLARQLALLLERVHDVAVHSRSRALQGFQYLASEMALPLGYWVVVAEAAVERARLTVVPRARTRAARVPFVSLVTLLLLGGVVGLLLFNTSMQQSSWPSAATIRACIARTPSSSSWELSAQCACRPGCPPVAGRAGTRAFPLRSRA